MIKGRPKLFYRFDSFRIDVMERLLFGAHGVISLTPKAFDTLLALVEHSGHVLSKEELMERVWPDSFVEENNLVQHVSALRKALSENDSGRKYIETVPKRGYRFVAEVRESLEGVRSKPQTSPHEKIRAGYNEPPPAENRTFLRDVVIIGRAIDFT